MGPIIWSSIKNSTQSLALRCFSTAPRSQNSEILPHKLSHKLDRFIFIWKNLRRYLTDSISNSSPPFRAAIRFDILIDPREVRFAFNLE